MEYCDTIYPARWKLYFSDDAVKPGTDSFLLADFTRLKPRMRVCDLGAGIGLLGLLLLNRQGDLEIENIELQDAPAALLRRNIEENHLQAQMRLHHGDLRRVRDFLPAGSQDLVITNPPYFKAEQASRDSMRTTARTECSCSLTDVCTAAAYLLRWGGRFSIVYRPERLTDLLCAMRDALIEPKRLRFVQKRPETAPILVLAEGQRGAKAGLVYDAPLIVYGDDGRESAEMDRIHFRAQRKAEGI